MDLEPDCKPLGQRSMSTTESVKRAAIYVGVRARLLEAFDDDPAAILLGVVSRPKSKSDPT